MSVKVMKAADITKMILNKDDLFILDVRNSEEYKEWKIEGESVKSINVPYFELLEGVDTLEGEVPKDKKVLVTCAKEGSSKFVAEQLDEAGYTDVYYLEGGMKTWSEYLHEVKVYQDEDITVYQHIRVGKGCLSYMVLSGDQMLIVDPQRFIDVYQEAAKKYNVKITHVVDSHLHADHISGGRDIAEKVGAKYYLMQSEGATFDFEALESHDKIQFEKVKLEVLAIKTPGHTPGSVSFFVNDKLLFSGDTIFVSGLGRPDLGGKVREWANDLYETIYSKVSQIADDVFVLPTHYADLEQEMNEDGYVGDTLGNIRQRNEKMFNVDRELFLEQVEDSVSDEKPPNFEEIIAINRGVESASIERLSELEIGPNRCAVHHTH